jgi:tetratricopeptide (TPR) repeat protein
MTRLGTRSLLASAIACAVAFTAGGAAAGKGKHALPNLVVTKVSSPPSGLVEGQEFVVKDRTRNRGKGKAVASTTRYYLTKDPAQSQRNREHSKTNPRTSETDILLSGARRVKALKRRNSSKGKTKVQVPPGTPAGKYILLACSDDRGVVKETKEQDNCNASRQPGTVRAVGGSSGRIDAFSDTYPDLDPDDEGGIKQALQLACIAPTPARKLTLDQAVKSADAYLTTLAGPGAMASFKSSPEYRSASVLPKAAGAAVLSDSPGAALAAELRAHELQPKEASHLENAAGVAAAIGLPNEAIAFLDVAARVDERKRSPLGISRQAAALSTRGYALLQLGKTADAERTLSEALAISPILNEEASMTLAAARACRGKDPMPAFRRGMRRKEPPKPPQLPVDESQAKTTELRPFPFPALPQNAAAANHFYHDLLQSEISRGQALVKRKTDLATQLRHVRQGLPELTNQRIDDLELLESGVPLGPDLQPLSDQLESLYTSQLDWFAKWGAKTLAWNQQSLDACVGAKDPDACWTLQMRSRCIPGTKPLYQGWLNTATKAYGIAKQYQRIYSRRVSSIASNFKTKVIYDYFLVDVPFNDYGLWSNFYPTASWAQALDEARDKNGTLLCIESPDPPPVTDPGAPVGKGSGPCPPQLKAVKAVFDLGFAKLKANCEEIKLSASTKGWIQAFGEVKYSFKGGSLTVFGGSKAEVGLGPLKGDFKSGIYVKTDMSGVKEVGWRVGPTFTAGAGPAEFSTSDYVDIKIIGSYGNPAH